MRNKISSGWAAEPWGHCSRWPWEPLGDPQHLGLQHSQTCSNPREGYLAGEPMEEAPGEVEHVDGPRDLGIHVLDANEPADGNDGPVAAQAVS